MNTIEHSTPVVVLKMEHYGALGIIRSLGRLGVPVYGVDKNRQAPGVLSKYCRGSFEWDVDGMPACSTVQFLISVARRLKCRPILVPTSDEMSSLVARNQEALAAHFIFPRQNAELVDKLCSKKELYFLAKSLGIPTAETSFPRSCDEVRQFLETAEFPVMLKGIDGARLEQRTGKKMLIVHSAEELLAQYERMEDPGAPNLMLQEYIPGGDDSVWMFNGYFDDNSDCVVGFTGKKIRQNPVYTGMTSLGICLRNDTVKETTKQFMKAVGYRGILDIGYRYDERSNSYKLLDANPRIGATFRLFVGQQGMDVVRALYLGMTKQAAQDDQLREGRKWIVEDKDLRSCYRYFCDGKLGVGDWLRSYSHIEEAGYFATDDVRPFVMMGISHLKRQIQKSLARLSEPLAARPRTQENATAVPGSEKRRSWEQQPLMQTNSILHH